MSAEITPAVERITDVLIEHRDIVCVTGDPDVVARDILDHALSVEEMACALYISDHPYDTAEQWRDHGSERSKDIYRTLARAIRTALLGADS